MSLGLALASCGVAPISSPLCAPPLLPSPSQLRAVSWLTQGPGGGGRRVNVADEGALWPVSARVDGADFAFSGVHFAGVVFVKHRIFV